MHAQGWRNGLIVASISHEADMLFQNIMIIYWKLEKQEGDFVKQHIVNKVIKLKEERLKKISAQQPSSSSTIPDFTTIWVNSNYFLS